MPRELAVLTQSAPQPCTYTWACLLCDERETCRKDKEGHTRWLMNKRMALIRYKVLVFSNRGGVGKSTVTTNLAVSLALLGKEVGVVDADLHGQSIPALLGGAGQTLKISAGGAIIPFQAYSIKVASLAWLLQKESELAQDSSSAELAVSGARAPVGVDQLIGGVEWPELDYLLLDLPPGMGNELEIVRLIGDVTGCLIITTPQEVALRDSQKLVTALGEKGLPLIGLVENMSERQALSPNARARRVLPPNSPDVLAPRKEQASRAALRLGARSSSPTGTDAVPVPFLGRIPFDPEVAAHGKAGEPFALFCSDSETAQAYHAVANQVDAFVRKQALSPLTPC